MCRHSVYSNTQREWIEGGDEEVEKKEARKKMKEKSLKRQFVISRLIPAAAVQEKQRTWVFSSRLYQYGQTAK